MTMLLPLKPGVENILSAGKINLKATNWQLFVAG
jgi:hypothetical protein